MFTCPVCEKRALSATRKLWLGPATKTTCVSCGASISVPWWSFVAGLPFAAAWLAPLFLPFEVAVVVWVVTGLGYALVHQKYVPIVHRKRKEVA